MLKYKILIKSFVLIRLLCSAYCDTIQVEVDTTTTSAVSLDEWLLTFRRILSPLSLRFIGLFLCIPITLEVGGNVILRNVG